MDFQTEYAQDIEDRRAVGSGLMNAMAQAAPPPAPAPMPMTVAETQWSWTTIALAALGALVVFWLLRRA